MLITIWTLVSWNIESFGFMNYSYSLDSDYSRCNFPRWPMFTNSFDDNISISFTYWPFRFKYKSYHLHNKLLKYELLYLRYSSPMTASDCYNLTLTLYKQEGRNNYNSHAAEWFEAALEKLDNEQSENTFTAIDVMKNIVKSHHRSNISLGWLLVKDMNIIKYCGDFNKISLWNSFLFPQTQKPTRGQRNYMI